MKAAAINKGISTFTKSVTLSVLAWLPNFIKLGKATNAKKKTQTADI